MYGLLSFSVAQRTRDIVIQMALGATRLLVLGDAMRQGMMTAAGGTLVGLLGALAAQQALAAMLKTEGSSWWLG